MKDYVMMSPRLLSDTGRSMVEMLGVLAIIGVLSVAGMAGYSYALVKYKANETMDELNKRSVLHATQLLQDGVRQMVICRKGNLEIIPF